MAVLDIFSRRGKPMPDVYKYDQIPSALRNQIVHIISDDLGRSWSHLARQIASLIAKEHGLLEIPAPKSSHYDIDGSKNWAWGIKEYVISSSVPCALDCVEIVLRCSCENVKFAPAIEELNQRFLIAGCGYQYSLETNGFIRIDTTLTHHEIVLPALSLLHEAQFKGAEDEYHKAHKHYREGRYEEALTDAAKAFESTMKTICDLRGWPQGNKNANYLIQIMVDKLVPVWTQEHLRGLGGLISSLLGVATVRNNLGAHGTGSDAREVPAHLAAYALHLAASNMLMLVRAHQAAPMQPADVPA